MAIQIKRVYEPFATSDGYRVLVDRLWPRGMSKEKLKVDTWLKEVAPSNELRKWFHHEEGKWESFEKKYKEELKNNPALNELKMLAKKHKQLTLVYGAKDEVHNQAKVLKEML